MQNFAVIDFSWMAFKYYHVFGENASAAIVKVLNGVALCNRNFDIICAGDTPTDRHADDTDYKAQRAANAVPVTELFYEAQRLLPSVRFVREHGYEADDVIATVQMLAEATGVCCVVYSRDIDTRQSQTSLYATKIERSRFVYEPATVYPLVYFGIKGKPSNNMPVGVPRYKHLQRAVGRFDWQFYRRLYSCRDTPTNAFLEVLWAELTGIMSQCFDHNELSDEAYSKCVHNMFLTAPRYLPSKVV